MIEIRINKDVGSYEAKFIGPLTMRQTICVCIAAPIAYFLYRTLSPLFPDLAGFFVAIPAGIAWLFGWTKPYGMRCEKFIQSIFVNMFLAPSHRKYKTVNAHEKALAELAQKEEAANAAANQNHKTKQKKTRYKVSSSAVK